VIGIRDNQTGTGSNGLELDKVLLVSVNFLVIRFTFFQVNNTFLLFKSRMYPHLQSNMCQLTIPATAQSFIKLSVQQDIPHSSQGRSQAVLLYPELLGKQGTHPNPL